MKHKVWKVNLDDTCECIAIFKKYSDAITYREACYSDDEACRVEGEYVPFYRYVITKD